mgnify:CR=1 FL=1
MDEPRIVDSTDDLTKTINIWLWVVSQRRPSLIRDLWTRKGEQHDSEKQRHARHELARYIAEKLATARHEVTRLETHHDRLWRSVRDEAE